MPKMQRQELALEETRNSKVSKFNLLRHVNFFSSAAFSNAVAVEFSLAQY
jgi:hypothetical protein